jgi:hypothetical protein
MAMNRPFDHQPDAVANNVIRKSIRFETNGLRIMAARMPPLRGQGLYAVRIDPGAG